jgi:hypothetical protein
MATSYYYTSQLQLKINGVYIDVTTPSTTTSKGIEGAYIIRAYKNVDGTITQLTDSSNLGNINVNAVRNTDKVDWVDSPQVQTVPYVEGNINKTKFVIKFKANTVPATFKPNITVTREETPGSTTNVSVNWQPTSTQTANSVTGTQTVNYTAAANTIPELPKLTPSGNLTDLYLAIGQNEKSSQVKWDNNLGQWVAVLSKKVGNTWETQIGYYGPTGSLISLTPKKIDLEAHGKNYVAAQKTLLAAINSTYIAEQTVTVGGIPPSGTFNPPNHYYTRKPSFAEIVKTTGNPTLAGDIGGNYALGRMVQDVESAKLLNTRLTSTKEIPNWGFRFTYNPSSISYSTTANTPIDWTLGTSDTANVLGGPTSIAFDLYLNRIADLAELNLKNRPNNYPKPLSDVDALGLKTRGTEYDLEFLYRIVNGSPQETDLTSTKQLTSDFGYITGVPFWLLLHDNMRYYVGLSTMSVNHVMFTTNLVPIFTVVSLTLTRYPVFDKTGSGYIDRKQAEAYQEGKAGKTTTVTTGDN